MFFFKNRKSLFEEACVHKTSKSELGMRENIKSIEHRTQFFDQYGVLLFPPGKV